MKNEIKKLKVENNIVNESFTQGESKKSEFKKFLKTSEVNTKMRQEITEGTIYDLKS